MPANLPPQYFETEKKLKTARTPQEKIAILEELLAIVPKHKGTEKLQALLKTKIAKLKSLAQKKPVVTRQSPLHQVEKAGAGQAIFIGPPNSGKSLLLKTLTHASPEIGDYPFTTRAPHPGMMAFENIQIQLVDTPPITRDYLESWQAELIKGSDGALVILDLSSSKLADEYQSLVEKLQEKRIEIIPADQDIPQDKQTFQKRALLVANKADLAQKGQSLSLLKSLTCPEFDLIPVSALRSEGLETLKNKIFSMLKILRVYSKIPGKKADLREPFVLKQGSTLMDMARSVHRDFAEKLKFARIWGKDKYQGQKVNRDYQLRDEDIIELHI